MRNELRLPCGCVLGERGGVFVVIACRLGNACATVQYARAQAAQSDKPEIVVNLS